MEEHERLSYKHSVVITDRPRYAIADVAPSAMETIAGV
jgi:hypothetical protein